MMGMRDKSISGLCAAVAACRAVPDRTAVILCGSSLGVARVLDNVLDFLEAGEELDWLDNEIHFPNGSVIKFKY